MRHMKAVQVLRCLCSFACWNLCLYKQKQGNRCALCKAVSACVSLCLSAAKDRKDQAPGEVNIPARGPRPTSVSPDCSSAVEQRCLLILSPGLSRELLKRNPFHPCHVR